MNDKLTLKIRLIFTGIVTILNCSFLAWDYFHAGVPTHHILNRGDLPGISNWWGGIILPLLTWFLLSLVQIKRNENNKSDLKSNFIYRFSGALLFGILLSVLFTHGSDISSYMMIGAILLSFFIPLFRPEYLLGFVLGMTYTVGPILPLGVGVVLIIIFLITYKIVRSGILYLISKIK
jgi:hypothetical protein